MKYLLLLMSSFFLVAPITTFASTPTKELRIVDHQVYLFEDGIQSTQLTTRGTTNFINDSFDSLQERTNYPEECGRWDAYLWNICHQIGYNISYQDKDGALVTKIVLGPNGGGYQDVFLYLFHQKSAKLQSIIRKRPLTHHQFSSYIVDNAGNLTDEITRAVNVGAYGGNFTRKERIELLKNGYNRKIFRDKEFPDTIYETYQKVFTLEQLKKLIK